MTKIVLITPILQHYRLSFYEKLSKANSDYDLTVFHGVKKKEDGKPGFIGDTRFNQIGFREYKFKIHPFEIIYNWGMYSEFKRINPDVVILQGITGDISNRQIISWARRKRKKIIIWTSGWEPGRAKGIMLKFKNKLVTSFFTKSNSFLTYSNYANRYVESMGIDASKIDTCFNGIETDDMVKMSSEVLKLSEEIKEEYDLDEHITFLYVGGLILEKRVDLLIDAFVELRKKNRKIKLIIIGDGPEKGFVLKKLKTHADQNIHFLGRIIEGVDPFFAACDCFVLPGIGGLALNQAMFWGKPCIVSKADGTEDDLVIENVSGYRFKEGDLSSLISAMERRINESADRIQLLSDNSKEIILKKSNVNNMVSVFSSSINDLIKEIQN